MCVFCVLVWVDHISLITHQLIKKIIEENKDKKLLKKVYKKSGKFQRTEQNGKTFSFFGWATFLIFQSSA